MSISVQCPGCKKKLKTKDELAGKRVKCPSCGEAIVVPVARSATLTKHETLKLIAELVEQQEEATRHHPEQLVAIYFAGRDAFLSQLEPSEWPTTHHLELEELVLVLRFMLSSSFMTAWFHLAGNKANRDTASLHCIILVGSFGFHRIDESYVEFESKWQRAMKQAGVAPGGGCGCRGLAALIIVGVGLFVAGVVYLAGHG